MFGWFRRRRSDKYRPISIIGDATLYPDDPRREPPDPPDESGDREPRTPMPAVGAGRIEPERDSGD